MKTIYIHIGIGKTGTFSIQEMLLKNMESFLMQNVLIPKTGIKYGMAHHNLAKMGEDEFSEATKRIYEDLVLEIDSSGADKVIISSELFSYVKPYYIRQVHEYLRKYDVKIVFYVREQVKLLESGFLQRLKAGNKKLKQDNVGEIIYDFKQFCSSVGKKDFNVLIYPWENEFGHENILCRLYDNKLISRNICNDFLERIGLNHISIDKTNKQINSSLIPEFINLIKLIDLLNTTDTQRTLLINQLVVLSDRFRVLASNRIINDDQFYKEIRQEYAKSNSKFADKYLTNSEKKIFLWDLD